VPLAVGQPRSVRLVDDVMRRDRLLTLVAQRDGSVEEPGPDALYPVGTVGVVLQLVVQGLERVRLSGWVASEPYLVARIDAAPDVVVPTTQLEALRRAAVDLFRRLVALVGDLPDELAAAAEHM